LAKTLTLVDLIKDRFAEGHRSRSARVGRQRRLDPDLMITATLEGRTMHYRPVPATGLRSRDYNALTEHSPNTYPYGLVNVVSKYAARIPHLFMDPAERDHVSDLCLIDLSEPDHPTPIVNVVKIRQIREDSLSTILEESIGSTESRGTSYTRTLIDPYG
jgi:hypothetical protein